MADGGPEEEEERKGPQSWPAKKRGGNEARPRLKANKEDKKYVVGASGWNT